MNLKKTTEEIRKQLKIFLMKVASQPAHILILLNAVTWEGEGGGGIEAVHFYASVLE